MWLSSLLRRTLPGSIHFAASGLHRPGTSRQREHDNTFRPRLEWLERRELLTAGFLDQSFGIHGKVIASPGRQLLANAVALQADGKIVVAGSLQGDLDEIGLVRFNSDGSVDQGFGNNGLVQASFNLLSDDGTSLVIQPDGGIVVAGFATGVSTPQMFIVARFTSVGAPDPNFGNGTGYVTTNFHDIGGAGIAKARSVTLQTDGKIVAAGTFEPSSSPGNAYFAVARYNPDGSLDKTFGGGAGEVLTDFRPGALVDDSGANAVAIQSDGRIVAAGVASFPSPQQGGTAIQEFALARYYADGTLDSDFNGDGKVTTPSFAFGGNETAYGLAIQPDGKLLAVGGDSTPGSEYALLRRYNPDGSLDRQYGFFGPSGTGEALANAVAVQADGRIVVAGSANEGLGSEYLLARFTPDFAPDTSFSYDGMVLTAFIDGGTDAAVGLAIQPDGKIIAAGPSISTGGESFPVTTVSLARYNGDAGQFQFASDSGALQGAPSVALTVVRIGGSSGAVTVDYYTSDGTATAGADYVTSGGTIYFADGQLGQTIYIPLHDDGAMEGGFETFQVTLVTPTGGAVLATTLATAVVTIRNFKVVTYPINGTEGTALTGKLATFVPYDTTIPASDYLASIVWTDGQSSPVTVTANSSGGFDIASPHVPAEEGSLGFTVTISLSFYSITAQGTVNVADALLTTQAVHLSVTLNKLFSGVVATFTDADPGAVASDYSATIDWKDGTTSTGTIGVSGNLFTVNGSHLFKTLPGTLLHFIAVTIVDHGPVFIVDDLVSDPPAAGKNPRHPQRPPAPVHRNRSAATPIGHYVEADEPGRQR
jgi:uncharacterized delta-60 repeat protein